MSTTLLPPQSEPVGVPGLDPAPPPAAPAAPLRRSRWSRLWHGPAGDPQWARPALFVLLAATAVLYLWGLGASGWANSFYAAAVQAGTKSWKAFFFGSSDSSNFITVDKTPASLWVMELSARVFGVNSWSLLVPQALEGVAAVGVLYATVKRWFGAAAGLVAGAIFALTPAAVLMFRFNNPDALLVLLLVLGAYAMTRALEDGRTRWLLLAGGAVGFGFLTKELQAFIVLPPFALAYLLAGPPKFWRRIVQLFGMGLAVVASAGWWVAIVQLWPASSRPYIGGSQNNSLWNVIFGYNGFGRLTGNESGSVGGGPAGGTGQWGPTGLTRMFNSSFGGQVSWLIPAALILLVGGLAFTLTRPRTDRARAALVLWGGWLLVTGLAFSLGKGIIHPYYTIALGPAIGAVVGIGGAVLWHHRDHWAARATFAAAVVASAVWSYELLGRTSSWEAWLRPLVLFGGLAVAVASLVPASYWPRAAVFVACSALVVGLAGPGAYALATASTPHTGAIPAAGPSGASGGFGPGGGFGPRNFAGGGPGGGNGNRPNFGNFGGGNAPNFGNGNVPNFGNGNVPNFGGAGGGTGNPFRGGGGGGIGGLLNGSQSNAQVTALLQQGKRGYRWAAAAVGANNAAGYQLASGEPIMSIGGFNGTDPAPSLAQFQQYVAQHKIHYFIAGGGLAGGFGGGGFGGGSSSSSQIASWVASNFTAKTVGGVTVYDLSSGATSSAGQPG